MLQSSRFASTTSVCARSRIGLRRARAAIAHDEIGFLRCRAANEDVGGGEAGGLEPLRGCLRDRRRCAGRVAGLDFHHLLIDLARELTLGLRRHRGGGALSEHRRSEKGHESQGCEACGDG